VSRFFEPPPDPWPDQAAPADAPSWTGRPQGVPLGVVVEGVLLARSDRAKVYIDYIDAYPDGFELEIRASTNVAYHELARGGDGSGPDPFGRHWPMVGERRDVLPPQLLRVGMEFADGRTATSIGGHDRPVGGPVMDALRGGGHGRGGDSQFHEGYWVSPLPPSGEVAIVCEWPAVEIAVARQRIDAQAIFDAAEKSRSMFGDKLKTAAHRDSRPGPGDASESPLTATMREPMASHYSSVFTEALAQHPRARSRRPFRPRPVAFVASFWRGPLCF
jgi:hypothetical protein